MPTSVIAGLVPAIHVDPRAKPAGDAKGTIPSDRIGVSLTEEDQLDPERSTSAIVVTHPQAKYFSV